MTPARGVIYSTTMVHMAGGTHAALTPFSLVLVDLEDGARVLGQGRPGTVPEIGELVIAIGEQDGVPIFHALGQPNLGEVP